MIRAKAEALMRHGTDQTTLLDTRERTKRSVTCSFGHVTVPPSQFFIYFFKSLFYFSKMNRQECLLAGCICIPPALTK